MDFGISSFKFYTCYRNENLYVDDGHLLTAFKILSLLDALATVHAENEDIIQQAIAELIDSGHTGMKYYPLSKPDISEEEAMSRVIMLAREAGISLLLRHVSSRGGLMPIHRARQAGQAVYGETCPHYPALANEVFSTEKTGQFSWFIRLSAHSVTKTRFGTESSIAIFA